MVGVEMSTSRITTWVLITDADHYLPEPDRET